MPVRRLNHAVLYVRELPRSVAFYTDVLGFTVDTEIPGRAAFLRAQDTRNDHDLGLFAVGDQAPGPESGRAGLYHLAWEVGTLGELAGTAERLRAAGALVGASDHLVSKSLYAKDPDGIEFEVMWRVPREDWPGPEHGGARVLPLDLDEALRRWGPDLVTGAAAGSAT
ncbi:VOC family protein [Streptomyces sp. NPDC047117]|uniref:VOC family protein n=1 Tax=Streptomyces sp. NPDC047117 TaxID=3155379 RepID=UPI0033FF02B7